jgi:hypothetical protein
MVTKYSIQLMSKLPQSDLVQLGIRFPAPFAREMKVHCAEKGITLKDFLNEAAAEKLAKEKAA